MKSKYAGFKGPPCTHCNWGPAEPQTATFNDEIEVDLGYVCHDCMLCLAHHVNLVNKRGSEAPVDEILAWLLLRGYRFRLAVPVKKILMPLLPARTSLGRVNTCSIGSR